MNLYQKCLKYLDFKENNKKDIDGYYFLGKIKTTGWKVVIRVETAEDSKKHERDVICCPMLLIPKYKNGFKTNELKECLELNSLYDYIFWEVKDTNKKIFSKIKNKITINNEIPKTLFVERHDPVFTSIDRLKEYTNILEYNFNDIKKELQNRFNIDIEF